MEIKTRETEWKLNQEKQKRNGNNKYVVQTTSYLSFPIFSRIEIKLIKSFVQLKDLDLSTFSIYQYIPGLPLVKKINQLEPSIMLNKRYIKSIKRDIFCFDFLSNILVSISFLLYIGKER